MSNEKRTIVVIGGVAAGAGAAAKARREDEKAEIVVFEKGAHVSFANCGLPYFVGDEIESRDALLLHTPESLRARFALDVRVNHEVLEIRLEARELLVRDASTGNTFVQRWDSLVIATGTVPFVPEIPGIHSTNVSLLRTVPDAEAMKTAVQGGAVKRAVVIGGGFIGLEAAENLRRAGVEVTLVERARQLLPPLDPEMAVELVDALEGLGAEVLLGRSARRFLTRGEKAQAVELDDGSIREADLFVLSVGTRPAVELARKAGIELGPTGAIAVNEEMATSIPGIWAAGDSVELKQLVSGKPAWIPLAGPANKQGRVAGANAAGKRMRFRGALGTSIVRVGSLTAGSTGLTERGCAAAGIECRITWTVHGHHAGYYPGAKPLTTKLLSERSTGRILGAQVIGGAGVDKRLDVFATAIHAGMHVADLEELDLAYAPPFGAAKDPVILAGMAHADLFRGELRALTPAEARARFGELQIVDVRNQGELKAGAIAGAKNIPLPVLRERLGELDPSRPTLVHCASGHRSAFAVRAMQQLGFGEVYTLTGGYRVWRLTERAMELASPAAATGT